MSDSENETIPVNEITEVTTSPKFKFTSEQVQVLQNHAPGIKAAPNGKVKNKLIKAARKAVQALPATKKLPLEERRMLAPAVKAWYARKSNRNTGQMKFGKVWSARLVMYEHNREAVNQLKMDLYEKAVKKGKNPKSPFDFFQVAMTEYWEKISDDNKHQYKKLAKEWNKEGVTREQKQE